MKSPSSNSSRNLVRVALGLLAFATIPATAANPPKRTPATVEAAWKPLAEEYTQALRLEALAALANKGDPKKYPLTNPTPFQKTVIALTDKLKPDVRKKGLDRAIQLAALPAAKRGEQFGRLPTISVGVATSVTDQYAKVLKERKPLVTRAMLDAVVGGDFKKGLESLKAEAAKPPTAAKVMNAVKTLRLELLEFWVVDDTTGWGDDEVRLGGVAMRVNGTTGIVNSFALGSFSDKQKRTYNPPRKLCDFNLTLTNKYPKQGAFTLSIAEADWGGTHQDAIQTMFNAVEGWVKQELQKHAAELGTALATLIGSPEFGPILGQIIGTVGDVIIEGVFGWLSDFFADDIFPPILIPFQAKTPAIWANGATHGPTHEYWVKAHGGHYKFKVRWAKVN